MRSRATSAALYAATPPVSPRISLMLDKDVLVI
jgi:hypothetical protein